MFFVAVLLCQKPSVYSDVRPSSQETELDEQIRRTIKVLPSLKVTSRTPDVEPVSAPLDHTLSSTKQPQVYRRPQVRTIANSLSFYFV